MTADEVGKLLNVSRETMCQFEAYLALLEKWQRRINLVANSTMVDAWQRHILDSAQLVRYYPPNTKKILDITKQNTHPKTKYLLLKGKKTTINKELKDIDNKRYKCEIIKQDSKGFERNIVSIKINE